jgi:RHS repeat-associated protein
LNQVSGPATTRATYVPDIQGSVIASLDASSGTLSKAGYQPYGESGSTAGTFRYTGARIDAETNGLYDFRARMYSPILGRFLQTDPIGSAGGINLYAYVGNDPLNLLDLYGLAADGSQGYKIRGAYPNEGYPTEGLNTADGVFFVFAGPLVGGLRAAGSSVATGLLAEDATLGVTAAATADAAQAAGATRGVAAALRIGEQTFTDISSGAARQIGNVPTPINRTIKTIIEGLPENAPFAGQCAEIGCLSQALNAGVNPSGGSVATAAIRAVGNPAQAVPVQPCVTCSQVLRYYGVHF